MSTTLEIRNVRLVGYPRLVCIGISEGCITSISEQTDPLASRVIDAQGMYLSPGLTDPHVHDRLPGGQDAEDWPHLVQAALRGGVTRIVKMPNTDPPLVTVEAAAHNFEAIGKQPINYSLWFGAKRDNHKEIVDACRNSGLPINGVKLYMAHSTGQMGVLDPHDQLKIFELCAEHNILLVLHCEDQEMIDANRSLIEKHRQPLISDHCIVRDAAVEVSAAERGLAYAEATGCRIHLAHISVPQVVDMAADACHRGAKVTVGICPQHAQLDSRCLEYFAVPGMGKMNPALRPPQMVQELRRCLWREDMRDILLMESDHAPHPWGKKQGNSLDIPSGVPGVQELLPVLLYVLQTSKPDPDMPFECILQRTIELTSRNPARLIGLNGNAGLITPGAEANLVFVNPDKWELFSRPDVASKCGWSSYEGMHAHLPQLVICEGKVAVSRLAEVPVDPLE